MTHPISQNVSNTSKKSLIFSGYGGKMDSADFLSLGRLDRSDNGSIFSEEDSYQDKLSHILLYPFPVETIDSWLFKRMQEDLNKAYMKESALLSRAHEVPLGSDNFSYLNVFWNVFYKMPLLKSEVTSLSIYAFAAVHQSILIHSFDQEPQYGVEVSQVIRWLFKSGLRKVDNLKLIIFGHQNIPLQMNFFAACLDEYNIEWQSICYEAGFQSNAPALTLYFSDRYLTLDSNEESHNHTVRPR